MRWIREMAAEWKARRRGAKFVRSNIYSAARQIVGPTGDLFSNGWKAFEDGKDAFVESFDPRVPPSIHISQREGNRANIPVPLVERCIEDWGKDATGDPAQESEVH